MEVNLVYSTNKNLPLGPEPESETATLAPAAQNLRVSLERAGRAGKTVTIVGGFRGTAADLQSLAKTLKTKCGIGGSAKDGQIILQGDAREKAAQTLIALGYAKTKRGN